MPIPKGSLTAAQYEIMDAIWAAGADGISVADVWQAISQARTIGRTTVLNQVDRLEKRGWLARVPGDGPTRFRATLAKDDASKLLVADFVSDYFHGSTVDLVSALLGNDACALTKKDVDRLRKLLAQARRRDEEDNA
ncbi:MAG TPA: BlaI/MecI/CopY family transcriptional regulator [Gemmataceae bacterium]|nr:BlaI/MecI/CopY family transcriptional regulator [Gemmataceae bacterium]